MTAKPQSIKHQALLMYQQGNAISAISRSLGISCSTVSKWVKSLGASKQARRISRAYRSITINITEDNWRNIEGQKVKSVYINEALTFYAKARKKDNGQLSFDF
ncbi:MAG: helix-turn-helix domain-containing protein [Muribaculaceae bacterium]